MKSSVSSEGSRISRGKARAPSPRLYKSSPNAGAGATGTHAQRLVNHPRKRVRRIDRDRRPSGSSSPRSTPRRMTWPPHPVSCRPNTRFRVPPAAAADARPVVMLVTKSCVSRLMRSRSSMSVKPSAAPRCTRPRLLHQRPPAPRRIVDMLPKSKEISSAPATGCLVRGFFSTRRWNASHESSRLMKFRWDVDTGRHG